MKEKLRKEFKELKKFPLSERIVLYVCDVLSIISAIALVLCLIAEIIAVYNSQYFKVITPVCEPVICVGLMVLMASCTAHIGIYLNECAKAEAKITENLMKLSLLLLDEDGRKHK